MNRRKQPDVQLLVWNLVRGQVMTEETTQDRVRDQVKMQIDVPIWDQIEDEVWDSIEDQTVEPCLQIRGQVREFVDASQHRRLLLH